MWMPFRQTCDSRYLVDPFGEIIVTWRPRSRSASASDQTRPSAGAASFSTTIRTLWTGGTSLVPLRQAYMYFPPLPLFTTHSCSIFEFRLVVATIVMPPTAIVVELDPVLQLAGHTTTSYADSCF